HLDYLEKVSGPGAANVHKALKDLLEFTRTPVTVSTTFAATMLEDMNRLFPQKAAYVGEAGLRAIVDEGVDEARRHQFTTVQQVALLVVLKFAFGHGCTADPLYPWISQTLADEKIVSPAARAERLEKKAITWLEHVVAANDRRSQP